MDDIFNFMTFGKKIRIYGEQWEIIKSFHNGFCLAIKTSEATPCQIYLIEEKEEE